MIKKCLTNLFLSFFLELFTKLLDLILSSGMCVKDLPYLSDLTWFYFIQNKFHFTCPAKVDIIPISFLIIMNPQCHVLYGKQCGSWSADLDLHCFQLSLYLVSYFLKSLRRVSAK